MLSKTYKIAQLNEGILTAVEDAVICEHTLTIDVGGGKNVALLCSPALLEELELGYRFCAAAPENRPALPDKAGLFTNEEILRQMAIFSTKSELFQQTGGVHSAAICDEGGIRYFAEDISRQSAVLKVIGMALKEGAVFYDKMLLVSCRVSWEIVSKAICGGFPVLVSRSAPTDAAIELARKHGLKLIGFARDQRMNIYTKGEMCWCKENFTE